MIISEFGISQWAKNHGIFQRSFGINKNIPGLGPQKKYSSCATSAAEKAYLSRMTPNWRMRKWNTELTYCPWVTMQCQFVFVSQGLWMNSSTVITMEIGAGLVLRNHPLAYKESKLLVGKQSLKYKGINLEFTNLIMPTCLQCFYKTFCQKLAFRYLICWKY